MEETNGGNSKAQVSHYHWCDNCGAETRTVAPWRSAKEQEPDGFS